MPTATRPGPAWIADEIEPSDSPSTTCAPPCRRPTTWRLPSTGMRGDRVLGRELEELDAHLAGRARRRRVSPRRSTSSGSSRAGRFGHRVLLRRSVGCRGPRLGWARAGLGKAYPPAHRRPFARVPGVLRPAGRQLRRPATGSTRTPSTGSSRCCSSCCSSRSRPTSRVAFDISRYSFRTREYPEYKGTRGETPPEFIGQIPLLEEALEAMGITTITQGGLRGRRHPRDPRDARGAEDGFRVLVVSGDRDTIQLVDDDVTLLYPNARGVSELKRYDRDAVRRALRHRAGAVSRDRGARRRDQRQPDRHRQGRREDRRQVDPAVRHRRRAARARRRDHRRRRREPARPAATASIRNRRLNRLRHRRRAARRPGRPRAPADRRRPRCARSSTGCSSARCSTGCSRSRARPKTRASSTDADGRRAIAAPAVRTMVDEELAKWLDTAVGEGHRAARPARRDAQRRRSTGFGIASATETAWVPWAPGRPDYTALEAWLASDAPKLAARRRSAS